jgi:hypothetical protein
VDHGVHATEAIHVAGDIARLLGVGQVADDDRSVALHEVTDSIKPVAAADVDDDLMPVVEQRLRRHASEAVCGAGDEDACHQPVASERGGSCSSPLVCVSSVIKLRWRRVLRRSARRVRGSP